MDVEALLARLPFEPLRHRPPLVTVLRLSGIIGQLGPLRSGLSIAGLAQAIERAFSPHFLTAVALSVNSPGGSPAQASLIMRRIRQFADERKVPVFAFVEDVAASGGYWLALAADEILVDESSILGSIGVISSGFGFHGLLERFGVERRVYTQGRHKSLLDPFRPESPEDVARLTRLQADIHDEFKSVVRARRGDRLKAPEEELFDGDVWTGRRAIELGLADGLGEIRHTMRARFGEKVRLRPVVYQRGWLRRRFGLTRDAQDWAGAALGAIEERAWWARYGL